MDPSGAESLSGLLEWRRWRRSLDWRLGYGCIRPLSVIDTTDYLQAFPIMAKSVCTLLSASCSDSSPAPGLSVDYFRWILSHLADLSRRRCPAFRPLYAEATRTWPRSLQYQ